MCATGHAKKVHVVMRFIFKMQHLKSILKWSENVSHTEFLFTQIKELQNRSQSDRMVKSSSSPLEASVVQQSSGYSAPSVKLYIHFQTAEFIFFLKKKNFINVM